MKIVVNNAPTAGIRLGDAAFGSVVQRPKNAHEGHYYIVMATMDGTGNRALVNLSSGNYVYRGSMSQDEPVLPVEAHVVVGDAAPAREIARDAKRYQALRRFGTPAFAVNGSELDIAADHCISRARDYDNPWLPITASHVAGHQIKSQP